MTYEMNLILWQITYLKPAEEYTLKNVEVEYS